MFFISHYENRILLRQSKLKIFSQKQKRVIITNIKQKLFEFIQFIKKIRKLTIKVLLFGCIKKLLQKRKYLEIIINSISL